MQAQIPVAPADLLKAAEKLNAPELDRFVSDVVKLRAQRVAPSLPGIESDLFNMINAGLPEDLQTRLEELWEKRDSESLTPPELQELLTLTEEAERLDVARLAALAELASLRKTSLESLMQSLGLSGNKV